MLNFYYIKSVCEQDISQSNSFSGETSSGKSTLINKILGIKLFKGKLAESTSTICKIRNSKQIKIITTNKAGEINENDFSNKCNLSKKEDVRILRNYLKKLTNVTHKHPDLNANLQTVDILLPVPFLKVNHARINTVHMQVCIFLLGCIIPIIQIVVVISYVIYDVCCTKQVQLGYSEVREIKRFTSLYPSIIISV